MKYAIFTIILFFFSCNSTDKKLTAQKIIDKSIEISGADLVSNSIITFDFRDNNYKAIRKNGKFTIDRILFADSISIRDIITNDGFQRLVNEKKVEVADSMATRFANSVNSVHYFSVLPFGLNDEAVKKKLLPEVTIKGKAYYKIQVSFAEENGGQDFDDVFIYWINKETFFVDYLAYEFHVNEGGVRFRELKEQCVRNGIRFVDYNNFKSENDTIKVADLDELYEKDQLIKVSEIVLQNIKVAILTN